MIEFKILTESKKVKKEDKARVVDFLHKHLENFGDTKTDIAKAIGYALKEGPSFGGFLVVAVQDSTIVGAVVVNQTGMEGYIPENILVYIATHAQHRGKGIGKKLMELVIAKAEGNIALHVEPHNPARFLYEKLGFSNKYLEMRLSKN